MWTPPTLRHTPAPSEDRVARNSGSCALELALRSRLFLNSNPVSLSAMTCERTGRVWGSQVIDAHALPPSACSLSCTLPMAHTTLIARDILRSETQTPTQPASREPGTAWCCSTSSFASPSCRRPDRWALARISCSRRSTAQTARRAAWRGRGVSAAGTSTSTASPVYRSLPAARVLPSMLSEHGIAPPSSRRQCGPRPPVRHHSAPS